MSFLSTWAAAHDMDREQCFRESGIDPETFGWLWSGSKTIPSIALTLGKNLGMSADEVQELGVTLHKDIWTGFESDQQMQKWTDPAWPERITTWRPGPTMARIGVNVKSFQRRNEGRRMRPCQRCGAMFTPGVHASRKIYCNACADYRALTSRLSETGKRVQMMREGIMLAGGKTNCPVCGKEFELRRADQRYCSEACKKKARYIIRRADASDGETLKGGMRCAECGKPFDQIKANQKYCSYQCQWKAATRRKREREANGDIRCMQQLQDAGMNCEYCGRKFAPKTVTQRFCSDDCRCQAADERKAGREKRLGTCIRCGESFATWRPDRKYCSEDCLQADKREKKKAARHAAWDLKPKPCIVCGKMFKPDTPRRAYCSEECNRLKKREYAKAWYKAKQEGMDRTITCRLCGEQFERKQNAEKYCLKCREKAALLAKLSWQEKKRRKKTRGR